MPRPYLNYPLATVRRLREQYGRQTMPELAAELGIPTKKLYALAQRQGIRKQWILH